MRWLYPLNVYEIKCKKIYTSYSIRIMIHFMVKLKQIFSIFYLNMVKLLGQNLAKFGERKVKKFKNHPKCWQQA
jgi:hypothetical protein